MSARPQLGPRRRAVRWHLIDGYVGDQLGQLVPVPGVPPTPAGPEALLLTAFTSVSAAAVSSPGKPDRHGAPPVTKVTRALGLNRALRSSGLGQDKTVNSFWPLFDLRVTTPRLEIRLPTDDDLYRLLEVTDLGIHDPATMPFVVPWTDVPAPRRHRESLQWWWSQRARWRPEDWSFAGAVFVDGQPVGIQDIAAQNFPARRSVTTGSWLGTAYQGQGLGKEMREAVLHLAFEGLGALEAHTSAFPDNGPSLGVTRSLGYVDNGHDVVERRGQRARQLRFCLDRGTWSVRRRSDISVEGLEACLEMFGLGR